MREDVDRDRLRAFLDELGRRFRGEARLYLAGGESMVWRGLRGTTRDIDVAYEVAPEFRNEWVRVIRELEDSMQVNIEEAEPSQFVPLQPGAEGRAEFVGRFGRIDVFLFDPYSVALSKLSRGHARDLGDVRALPAAGVLGPERLRELVRAALPPDGPPSLRVDPERIERHLESVLGPTAH